MTDIQKTAILLLLLSIAIIYVSYSSTGKKILNKLDEWQFSRVEYELNSIYPREKEYIVNAGDTIWTIAENNCSWIERRLAVWAIQEKNNIDGHIRPGQRIIIPAPIELAEVVK